MKTMNIKAKMIRKTVVAISTTLAVFLFFAGFAIPTYAQENTNIETTMTIDGLVNNCEIITCTPSSVPYSRKEYDITITKEVDKNTPILINAKLEGKDNLSGTIVRSGLYRFRFIGGQIKEVHIDPRGEDEGPEEKIVIHVKDLIWEHYMPEIEALCIDEVEEEEDVPEYDDPVIFEEDIPEYDDPVIFYDDDPEYDVSETYGDGIYW